MADLRNTLIRPVAWAFYVVLVFEILFMISPAALFFYSVYGPVLGFLNGAPATAWLTQFFLPHIAATETRRGKFQTTNFSSPTRISFAP